MSEDRYTVRITAEGIDIVSHPTKRCNLIKQSPVATDTIPGFPFEFWMYQEAKGTQPIIHGNDDDTPTGQVITMINRKSTRACREAAAVEPNHHGQIRIVLRRNRPNIQIEAIFRLRLIAEMTD